MSYIQKIRAKIGHEQFIHPAARIIVENRVGEVLFIERIDNGKLGLPAGALEENETIEDCIRREVKEETGLIIQALEVIGISSNPAKEAVSYPNGDQIQYFTIEFYSSQWEGELQPIDKAEVKTAQFLPKEKAHQLPTNEQSAFESLSYYRKYGRVMLK